MITLDERSLGRLVRLRDGKFAYVGKMNLCHLSGIKRFSLKYASADNWKDYDESGRRLTSYGSEDDVMDFVEPYVEPYTYKVGDHGVTTRGEYYVILRKWPTYVPGEDSESEWLVWIESKDLKWHTYGYTTNGRFVHGSGYFNSIIPPGDLTPPEKKS